VVPKNGRPLDIGVPNKLGYKEFVSMAVDSSNRTTFHGFCIDVFEKALAYLPYSVTFNFHRFGNGSSTPSYDALVAKVVNKDFDAVVGDVTITTKRSLTVDFTQPYVTSGLVVVVPVKPGGPGHAWAFMRPFTPIMWCTTGVFFFFTGLVMWLLEHKKNRDFRGRPKKQVVTTLWFVPLNPEPVT
jgi:ionotropic glutamate receptor